MWADDKVWNPDHEEPERSSDLGRLNKAPFRNPNILLVHKSYNKLPSYLDSKPNRTHADNYFNLKELKLPVKERKKKIVLRCYH